MRKHLLVFLSVVSLVVVAKDGFPWRLMGTPTVTAAADSTPDQFAFVDNTGLALSTQYESNTITVTGINGTANVSIAGNSGEYSKNGGAYTTAGGTAVLNDTFKVRQTSSGSPGTAVDTTLTIGGVSDTWSVTTATTGGDILNEMFTATGAGNAGFDAGAQWTLTQGGTNTVSGDEASTPTATGFSGQWMKMDLNQNFQNTSATWTDGADHSIAYISFRLYLASGADDSNKNLIRFFDSAGTQVARLFWSYSAGNYNRLQMKFGSPHGSEPYQSATRDVALNTSYRVKIKLDSAGSWEFDVVGVSTPQSASEDPGNATRSAKVGVIDAQGSTTMVYYIDNFQIDSAGYIAE